MKKLLQLLSIAVFSMAGYQAMAAAVSTTFSEYAFGPSQYSVDADPLAIAFYEDNYGVNINNAYLYKDGRDTFDGIGLSVGPVPNSSIPELGTLSFLGAVSSVEIDYWTILETTYSAFNGMGTLLDSFVIGANTLGTYSFGSSDISYLTWESDGGFGQISSLRYDSAVPEASSIILLGLGLAGLGFSRRSKKA